jgi:hypothetical protein
VVFIVYRCSQLAGYYVDPVNGEFGARHRANIMRKLRLRSVTDLVC